ncbi:hypothetical protein ABZZ17_39505 [Streptomyces sp. NPDC006512]|uniref:hypothetical protein n=1 Tax=Streptomyces sp. NPDC006512 TaxID=3154307 RepID=UPI0033A2E9E3
MKTARYMTVPLILGLALTATTAATSLAAPTASHTSHTSHTSILRTVTLTNADNGRTFTVAAGDDIRVRLTGGPAQGLTWAWSVPVAGDPGVLRRTQGAQAPNGDATAVFSATEEGESIIAASARCVPATGSPCPPSVQRWSVTIDVQ